MKIKLIISSLLMTSTLPVAAHTENSLSLSAHWHAHLLLAGAIFGLALMLSFAARRLIKARS